MAHFLKRLLYALLWIGAFAALGAAVANYALSRYQRQQARHTPYVATVPASKGDFVVYTDQVGILEAEESTIVQAETSGQVIGVVPNGTEVKQNDVIVALDVPRMLLALEEAQRQLQDARDKVQTSQHDRDADVQQCELTLKTAETALEQAQAKTQADRADKEARLKFDQEALAQDEARLQRKRRQADMGLIAAQEVRREELRIAGQRFALDKEKESLELDIARAKSDSISKEASVRTAKTALQRAKARRDDDMRGAKVEAETAQRALDRAREDLEKAFIRAPKGGLVALTERGWMEPALLQEGDMVRTNQPVAQILELSKMQVHLELPQRVGQMVKRGMKASVSVHGIPGQEFAGSVTQVASFASPTDRMYGPSTEERSFRTYVRIAKVKPGLLKPGMRATVRVIIARLEDVVSVPIVCVFNRGAGKNQRHVVWVRDRKRFKEVSVKLGEANDESVVIEKGVSAGTEIALRDLQSESAGTPGAKPSAVGPQPGGEEEGMDQ